MKFIITCLFGKKLRTMLTVTGIAVGVASVVIISIISSIGKNAVIDELDSIGMNGLIVSSVLPVTLTDVDLETISSVAKVSDASPLIAYFTSASQKNKSLDCALCGIGAGSKQIVSLELLHGRLISGSDIDNRRMVCVVDSDYARASYGRENIVGKKLTVSLSGSTQELEIVGIVSCTSSIMQSLTGSIVPYFLYIPYTSLQELTSKMSLDSIAVSVDSDSDVDLVSDKIVSALSRQNSVPKKNYCVQNLISQRDKMSNILEIISFVLTLIAGISLIVSGLSIMNVMTSSVSERTREIGIKKAVGATNSRIMFDFLLEALIISALGCIIGGLFGIISVSAGAAIVGVAPVINVRSVLSCMTISVILCCMFGVYPAYKASKLQPAEALRRQ